MPWEENRNMRSLSPHGLKEAQGHATRGVHDATNSVGCPPTPPGILSMTPLGAGRSSPYMPPPSSARPRDEPREIHPRHTSSPHKYGPATERESVVITPRTK